MSIRTKITIMFLAVALAPILLVGFITFHNFRDSLESNRILALQDVAIFKADKIETYFAWLKTDIEIAQNFYNIRQNLPVLTRFTKRPANSEFILARKMLDGQLSHMQSDLDLADIMLLNPEGKVVYAADPVHYSREFMKLLSDPLEKSFTEGRNGIYITDVFLNEMVDKKPEMLVSAPVLDFNGIFAGVIVFEVDMSVIYRIIRDTTGLGRTGETLVGKRMGNEVIYINHLRHDPEAALKRKAAIGDKIGRPMQEAVQGRTGTGVSIDYRGEEVIAAWRYIPSLKWGVVSKIDTREAFSDVIDLRKLVMMIVVIIFSLAGIMAFPISQSIANPIEKLSRGVKVVGSGNLDYKVANSSMDEIGQLSRTFDKMVADLKKITASRDELNREVDERKKAEESLRRSNENLEQFAYVASHDLQEPLRMMASYSELLDRRYKSRLDADADEFINYIVDGAKRMQKLINDLLAYSRVGKADKPMELIDFNAMIERVISGIMPAVEESGAVITHDKLPVLMGNESNFIQLFQNLIANAVKFRGDERPLVHIGAKMEGKEWIFFVRDNGIGIEPQYREKIFLIFQRLHSRDKYPGTGIGLSICKKIVETHGGRIWLESEPGKGTTFYFTYPVKKEEV